MFYYPQFSLATNTFTFKNTQVFHFQDTDIQIALLHLQQCTLWQSVAFFICAEKVQIQSGGNDQGIPDCCIF